MSTLNKGLIKVLAVFLIFCFAECAAGSCLKYGHACWGAHGKRSGGHNTRPDKEDFGKLAEPNWFISRLIKNPSDLRYAFESGVEGKDRAEIFPSSAERQRLEDWNLPADDQFFEDTQSHLTDVNKIRLPNRMEKRSIHHN